MRRIAFAGLSAVVLLTACAGPALAAPGRNLTTKKMQIKDPSLATKRQILVQSMDPSLTYADADSPDTDGAWVHVYSATDDYCAVLSNTLWTTNTKTWKYNDKVSKSQVQLTKGKLQVKMKGSLSFGLQDNASQGAVNVIVKIGEGGPRLCMRCSTPVTKDTTKLFSAKDCAATACDAVADGCLPAPTTTTTVSTTTTTTVPPFPGLHGALPKTVGNFTYAATTGIPGANAQCNIKFPGTHACTYAELQNAQTLGQLVGLKDTATPTPQTVTSFWAIDSTRPANAQCQTTVPWDYQTAHTGKFADIVTLNNATGILDPLVTANSGNSATWCLGSRWVGCCF